jgi:prevent-host-death family protein
MPATQSVSFVKAHLAEVIHEVNASRNPLVVTQNGASTVVIQDHDSYQRTREALMMLKLVAMGEADVAKGRTIPQAEVFGSLKKRLKAQIAAEAKAGKQA